MFTAPLPRRAIRRTIEVIDALAAPHGIDRYVEQVFPTWSSTEVRGRIVTVDRSATGSVRLGIEPNRSWTGFRAGQHTQLTVEIDGIRHTRCYSMCNAAGSGRLIELGIKAHPEGLVSQHLVAEAAPGMVVRLTPAAGDFHLPDARPERVLLISGGSGITPVLSMLRTLCAEGHDGPVTFLHYNSTPDVVIAHQEIADLEARLPNVRVVTAYDQQPDAGDLVGWLSEDHLVAADPQWWAAETYVCGPEALMGAARAIYQAAGVSGRLHQEAFTLPAFVGEAGTVGGSVRFGASDLVIENDGRPLLEQAEAAGLDPAHGCRMGICHTCTRSLTSGCVRDAVTGALTSESDVEIRICVSVPIGDVEIDL
jgi:stearoyl-CoA 9-desaturase NADPH oxidoreductase